MLGRIYVAISAVELEVVSTVWFAAPVATELGLKNEEKTMQIIRNVEEKSNCKNVSVADPEGFTPDPDPALNFPSSGSMRL